MPADCLVYTADIPELLPQVREPSSDQKHKPHTHATAPSLKAVVQILPCPFNDPPSSQEVLASLIEHCTRKDSPLVVKHNIERCTQPGGGESARNSNFAAPSVVVSPKLSPKLAPKAVHQFPPVAHKKSRTPPEEEECRVAPSSAPQNSRRRDMDPFEKEMMDEIVTKQKQFRELLSEGSGVSVHS